MVAGEIEQVPSFDLSANWLCLNFVNTLENRLKENMHENLHSYADFVEWSRQAELLTDAGAERLLAQARGNPEEASAALVRAKDLREAMYHLFLAIAEERQPEKAGLDALNAELGRTMIHAHIVRQDGGFAWGWDEDEGELDRPLWPIIRSAVDLLTGPELNDVRVCAAEDCGWLFLDTSKNHTRRWCSMKSCGNRAKARRHYNKEKTPTS